MSRYCFNAKTTVEDSTQLNIFKLKEFGLLKSGCCKSSTLTWTYRISSRQNSIGILVDLIDEPYAKVDYVNTNRITGKKTDYNYKIRLTTTPCHFGGVRYWFICPLIGCGRRTGTLYLTSGGNRFGCRYCYNLSYESRNESKLGRYGAIGYFLVLERHIREYQGKVKRRYWRGLPTRKYMQLLKMQQKLDRYIAGRGGIEGILRVFETKISRK